MIKIPAPLSPVNHRILVIDDNPSIHDDFRKVLTPAGSRLGAELDEDETTIFGETREARCASEFELDFAFQGREGLDMVRTAALAGMPYAVAFVDVRMPPGWDGIETITHIWEEFPDLQIVICTAYSDYSWEDITRALGTTDQVLVLKKPFDHIEVTQMAHALCKKWQLTQIADRQMAELEALVQERTAELREANARLTAEIAERSAAQDAMLSSEERFSKAFHRSPVPMAVQRIESPGFLDANERFFDLLGFPRAAVLAGEAAFWADDTTPARICDALSTQRTVQDMAVRIRTAGGDTREVMLAAENLVLGNAPFRLLILQDITERIRIDSELRQAQSAEPAGPLATGVAHDINDILTVILGNASFELCKRNLDTELSGSLQQVVLAAERANALTRQLLAHSSSQAAQRRPFAHSLESAATSAEAATSQPGGKSTILAVEDDETLRVFLSRALGKLGYRVLTAPDGTKALETWAAHRDEIHLLLTDVFMPGPMCGRQLAHRLLADRPDLKVIFTSGHSAELSRADPAQHDGHAFLPKPYVLSRLAETIAAQFRPARPASAIGSG